MLEQEDALPGAEYRLAVLDGNGQLARGEGGAEMRRHVVGTFLVMFIAGAFGGDALEIGFEVPARGRCSILLDDERRGGMAAKKGRQPLVDAGAGDELAHRIRKFVEAGPNRLNRQSLHSLAKHIRRLARR